MTTTEFKPRDTPGKASSRAEFEKRQKGRLARGPSGLVYKLRQMDLTRHALSGGLPTTLVKAVLAEEGSGQGLSTLFKEMAGASPGGDDEQRRKETIEYLDKLVIRQVIEPELKPDDLPDPTKLEDTDALVPADDYTWLVQVAFRATDLDGDGKHIWGMEDLSRFHFFRHFHGCDADCNGCEATRLALSPTL